MVNDTIAELLDLQMEPKPESLWQTGTHQADETKTLSVENRGRAWDLPFKDVFEVLGYRLHRDGNGYEGADRTLCKGFASWWQIHLPVEERTHDNEVSKSSQSRLQHYSERQRQVAVAGHHACQGARVGV